MQRNVGSLAKLQHHFGHIIKTGLEQVRKTNFSAFQVEPENQYANVSDFVLTHWQPGSYFNPNCCKSFCAFFPPMYIGPHPYTHPHADTNRHTHTHTHLHLTHTYNSLSHTYNSHTHQCHTHHHTPTSCTHHAPLSSLAVFRNRLEWELHCSA